MIQPIRIFCIYCRRELTNQKEITLQYHISCQNEFKVGSLEFETFDSFRIENFIEKLSISKKISIPDTFFLTLLMFGSAYLFLINSVLSVLSVLILLAFIISISYNWQKKEDILYFCNIIKNINPQFIYLTKNYCLAIVGEIYIVNNPKKFNLFNGMYIIKFLNSKIVDSNKNIYPEAPLKPAYKNRVDSIQVASSINECQIRYNSKRAQRGLASIYYIRYKDLRFKQYNFNKILSSLNNKTETKN